MLKPRHEVFELNSRVRVPLAASNEESGLAVSSLSIDFSSRKGLKRVVSGVSLSLDRGETVGLVGESGSGKSMTALSVLGLLPPGMSAAGSIKLSGQELVGMKRSRLHMLRGTEMSLVMQDPSTMLNPLRRCVTSVEEGLIATDLELTRRSRRREALDRLEEVGIGAREALRFPFQVSGGMAQRIGLAAALAGDPKILIADEPTTALDVTTQKEILGLLESLRRRRSLGLLLITHDLQVAFDVCDRVYVMYAGRILESATPDDLKSKPLHPYTAALLRSEPDPHARRERLDVIKGTVPSASDVADRCAFYDRCQWAKELCRSVRPPLVTVAPRHDSACVRIGEIQDQVLVPRREGVDGTARGEAGKPQAILSLEAVSKTFTQRRGQSLEALKEVTLEVGLGRTTGLVGESGSGKTTLARCIVGLATPSSGRIRVGGLDASNYGALTSPQRVSLRRTVQIAFQNPYATLNPALSIQATLAEALAMAEGVDRRSARSRVGELLELVGLSRVYAGRKPAALSGGERQRVAIARSLAVKPRLLVCDEVTSALDVSVQAQILNLLRDLQADLGLSILFISHDLGAIRQVADDIYVLRRGQVVEEGNAASVLDMPGHAYTTELLNSIPGGNARRNDGNS